MERVAYPVLGLWAHEISRKQRHRAEESREERSSSEEKRKRMKVRRKR